MFKGSISKKKKSDALKRHKENGKKKKFKYYNSPNSKVTKLRNYVALHIFSVLPLRLSLHALKGYRAVKQR
jgi:hypothetical protein